MTLDCAGAFINRFDTALAVYKCYHYIVR